MWAYLTHYFWLAYLARIFLIIDIPIMWMALCLFVGAQICIFISYKLLGLVFGLCGKKKRKNKEVKVEGNRVEEGKSFLEEDEDKGRNSALFGEDVEQVKKPIK